MPGTVTVACKLPNGLLLQLSEMRDEQESSPVGPRTIKRSYKAGKVVSIKGFAHAADKGPTALIVGGFALTPNVDADFFTQWMEQNRDSDLVQNGFIYAASKSADAEAHAKEYKDEKCGLEPLDPTKPPPEFRNKIATADATA